MLNLTLDGSFDFILEDNFTWQAISVANRGLEAVPDGLTARQKAALLTLFLGTVAGYAPVISRQYITQEACSLSDIWHRLRIRFGFRKSGALILDLASFQLEEGESYEALWERLHAFTMDNLMDPADGLKHLKQDNPPKEVMSPTLLNSSVVRWLRAIHPSLPALVKQKFSTELRGKTLATIREDISESLDSMVAELNGETAASIARSGVFKGQRGKSYGQSPFRQRSSKVCPLCDASNRPSNHFLSECSYLPEADRRYMAGKARTRVVDVDQEQDYESLSLQSTGNVKQVCCCREDKKENTAIPAIRSVAVKNSPYLFVKYDDQKVKLTLDSGAEANMMKLQFAEQIGAKIYKASTGATQADGISTMDIAGEVHLVFRLEDIELYFDGLVSKDLSDDVLAGVPFMMANDVYARPSKKLVYFGEREFKCEINSKATRAEIVRIQRQTVLLPGDSITLPIPASFTEEEEVAVEPRMDAPSCSAVRLKECWLQPQILKTEGGHINLFNNTSAPVKLGRHEQVAVIRPVTEPVMQPIKKSESVVTSPTNLSTPTKSMETSLDYLDVSIDPDGILSKDQQKAFKDAHEQYQEVFDSTTLGKYNGHSGPLEANINMGPTLPPQRKGRMPMYSRSMMEEQQKMCDELEGTVLLKPEDIGVVCEYLSPSFLVMKKSGKKRLVTAFGEIGQYAKPQPALMPDTNAVLRQIGNYLFIIVTDLSGAYWQIPLSTEAMRYCGIATPYKGVRVYGRCAMGMPGSETALEELMCRILGDQLAEGGVCKLADDIYCGGSTPEEALMQWKRVLQALKDNGLRLSASKTTVCPKSVSILGWIWETGSIRASPHKLSTLAVVDLPSTVCKLRSYIGSYKYLSRVLKGYSEVLRPLEEMVAGRDTKEKLEWNNNCITAFRRSQDHLKSAKSLTMPRKEDQLQIVCDASNTGVGAALFVLRAGVPHVAGYFSSPYRKHQTSWMPCEAEALSISAAVTHFSPYIVQSTHQTMVLSDSLPCVQAFRKMLKGEFSSSARVSTFLSVICRFNIQLVHLKGSENIYADYASRNAVECGDGTGRCQVCNFIDTSIQSVVRSCTVQEVLESSAPVPYNSRSGWFELQVTDDTLRRACAHLKQGTKPARNSSNLRDVKRYLQSAKVANDGLVVVPEHIRSVGRVEKIVVPRKFIHALLECLHLKLNHPSKLQLKKVFSRAFFALDLEQALETTAKCCHTCVSLSDMPTRFLHQSSTTVPTAVGSNFAADVVKRRGQSILVIREYVSAYTAAKLIWNEKASTIRTALLVLTSDLIPSTGMKVTIKVDPASACRALSGDSELLRNGIKLELGHPKYKNKVAVVDRAIRELHSELNRVNANSGEITEKILMKAIQTLNCRIRGEGVSAREIWTKRNQYSGEQIPVDDLLLMREKERMKKKSHIPSATYKARGRTNFIQSQLRVGDLVYINSDRDKLHSRDRYVITKVGEDTCDVQKFTGLQLRARVYTVNKADLLTVQPWSFNIQDNILSEGDSDDEYFRKDFTDLNQSTEEKEEGNAQNNSMEDDHSLSSDGSLGDLQDENDPAILGDDSHDDLIPVTSPAPEPLMGADGKKWSNVDKDNILPNRLRR